MMLACAALMFGLVRFSCLAIDIAAGSEDIEASVVEVSSVKRGGDVRKGGFSGEVTEVDFVEVRGGVEESALHRIEPASIDGDEAEFFATCAAGDRIRISIDPDAGVDDGLLMGLCDHSYRLVFSKLTKKSQKQPGKRHRTSNL